MCVCHSSGVEVKGQAWVLVFTTHRVWGKVSCSLQVSQSKTFQGDSSVPPPCLQRGAFYPSDFTLVRETTAQVLKDWASRNQGLFFWISLQFLWFYLNACKIIASNENGGGKALGLVGSYSNESGDSTIGWLCNSWKMLICINFNNSPSLNLRLPGREQQSLAIHNHTKPLPFTCVQWLVSLKAEKVSQPMTKESEIYSHTFSRKDWVSFKRSK